MKLNIQQFASTNKTANYELPQFVGTDKPTWLGDFNEAMADIDTGMHANATAISGMQTDVATATATASQASQDVTTLSGTVTNLSGRVTNVETTANNAQSTANSALNVANTKVSTNDLFDLVYPVGSIYLSINNTSPSTLFGGSWTQIKDTFLLGAGDDYTLGDTGGEATHTLTINEMPSHVHNTDKYYNTDQGGNDFYGSNATGSKVTTSNGMVATGGDQPHNNMPPYLVVSIWKRVS